MNITDLANVEVLFSNYWNNKINYAIHKYVHALKSNNQSYFYYSKYRNSSTEKALKDNFCGKKGEAFVNHFLRYNKNFPCINVDLKIRSGKEKGWFPDLPYKGKNNNFPNIHVKTCSRFTLDFVGDYSWTFQVSNNNNLGGKDEIFKHENYNDIVSLVYLENPEDCNCVIKRFCYWRDLVKHLKDPIRFDKKGIKKCIYLKDL